MVKRKTPYEYIELFIKMRADEGRFYSYENFTPVNCEDKGRIMCPLHGEFLQSPSNHLRGQGCPSCKIDKVKKVNPPYNIKDLQNKSDETHGKGRYIVISCINAREKAEYKCNVCGKVFWQFPSNHNRGHGCKNCPRKSLIGLYSHKIFKDKPRLKSVISTLYIIHLTNLEESFYKVGITISCVSERFKGSKLNPYSLRVVLQVRLPLYEAFLLEQRLLNLNDRYIPKYKFHGHTECIKLSNI